MKESEEPCEFASRSSGLERGSTYDPSSESRLSSESDSKNSLLTLELSITASCSCLEVKSTCESFSPVTTSTTASSSTLRPAWEFPISIVFCVSTSIRLEIEIGVAVCSLFNSLSRELCCINTLVKLGETICLFSVVKIITRCAFGDF